MILLLIGIGILGSVICLFYLKNKLRNPTLARLAYSGLIMRFTVIAVVMIVIGILFILKKQFT
jgi:hypothetical protein